jgi:hypothetical protein
MALNEEICFFRDRYAFAPEECDLFWRRDFVTPVHLFVIANIKEWTHFFGCAVDRILGKQPFGSFGELAYRACYCLHCPAPTGSRKFCRFIFLLSVLSV